MAKARYSARAEAPRLERRERRERPKDLAQKRFARRFAKRCQNQGLARRRGGWQGQEEEGGGMWRNPQNRRFKDSLFVSASRGL